MKIISCFLLFLLLIPTINSQPGWQLLNSGTNIVLRDVCFINDNTGWVVGYNSISQVALLKTTNGGVNWISQVNNGISSRLNTLKFFDQNTGWVKGSDGGLYKTTNGGNNYIQQSTFNSFWQDCFFLNINTGWASGYTGLNENLFKTTNSGANWINAMTNNCPWFTSIFFTDINTGYGAVNNGAIYKTTNRGSDFWPAGEVGFEVWLKSIFFTSGSTGYVCALNRIFKTSNSGSNWIEQSTGVSLEFNSLFFVNSNIGWSCGYNGKVIKTTNAGTNWFSQVTPTSNYLNQIIFVNQNTGYAVGEGGVIIKTTDGGGPIGIKQISSEIPESFMLYQNYPNPFNPNTKIVFSIPPEGAQYIEPVQLIVYDILGREIATLVNEVLQPGTYEVEFYGSNYSSGVYYYILAVGDNKETKKMVLIK